MNKKKQDARQINLVLADDQVNIRRGIRKLLEEFEELEIIGEAADGEAALELVAKMCPDVLITDLRMPKAQGMEIILKAKQLSPETKIIVFSMYEGKAYAYSAFKAGADSYISKDSEMHNLYAAIRTVSEGKRYFSELLSEEALEIYCLKTGKPSLRQESHPIS
jgi:DNA-binding NarL/FixJ family response regulator